MENDTRFGEKNTNVDITHIYYLILLYYILWNEEFFFFFFISFQQMENE